jgi:superfamily II RNA helicase
LEKNKFIEEEYNKFCKKLEYESELQILEKKLENTNNYVNDEVMIQIKLLLENNFIKKDDGEIMKLTQKGKLCIAIQELASLPIAELISDDVFNQLSSTEIVGVLSCFTNLHLSDEMSVHNINSIGCSDKIKNTIRSFKNIYNKYYDILTYNKLEVVEDYNMHYNLTELALKWCKSNDESVCKKIISEAKQYDISLGDFVKAILKINNIALELEKVAIIQENLSLLEKLKEIPYITLKSCITNQSLYL